MRFAPGSPEMVYTNVRKLMEKHGLTQKELAEILGQEVTTAQKKAPKKIPEKGLPLSFTLEDIVRLADYFNVSLDTIAGRDISESPLSLSDILQFLFRVSRQYDVMTISDPNNTLYEDIDGTGHPSAPYTLTGLTIRCKEWNDAVDTWSATGGYPAAVAERMDPGSHSNEIKRNIRDMVEKQLVAEYKDVLPLPKNSKALRGILFTGHALTDSTGSIDE